MCLKIYINSFFVAFWDTYEGNKIKEANNQEFKSYF